MNLMTVVESGKAETNTHSPQFLWEAGRRKQSSPCNRLWKPIALQVSMWCPVYLFVVSRTLTACLELTINF
jgi:hypothetical protein